MGLTSCSVQGFVTKQKTFTHSTAVGVNLTSFTNMSDTSLLTGKMLQMHIPGDVLLDGEEIHKLTMYQGQGTFAATYKNGTPWIAGRTKHKLFKIGLPECRCSTASFWHAA